MTAQDYDTGKKTLTLQTTEAINIPGFGRRQSDKLSQFYFNQAKRCEEWEEVFRSTQWEIPGWSHSLSEVASMFGRAYTIEQECLRLEIMPSELVNEERVLFAVGRVARAYDYPFYCVGKKMLEAVMQTKPIEKWDFAAFPLPFPCVTFLLPKGVYFGGQPMSHLIIFQHSPSEQPSAANAKTVFIGASASFLGFLGVHSTDDDSVLIVDGSQCESTTVSEEQAQEAALSVMHACLNLIGVMHARKELIESDRVLRVVGKRNTVVKAPRMLGSSYTYRTVSAKSEPTGRKVTSHWRKAHWHTVLYGPGRSMKRLDWFEPVFVSSTL
jgi:hypothetical protein